MYTHTDVCTETISEWISENPLHTHTMAKNIFHYQSIALSINKLTNTTLLPKVDWSASSEVSF